MPDSLDSTSAAAPAMNVQSGPDRTTLIAFGTFVLLGGGAALSVRFIYGELAPFWSGTLRFGLAATIFIVLMLVRRVALPRGRALLGAVLFGSFTAMAILLSYFGLTKIQASLFQTIAAVVPLLTLLFAAAHRLEPLSRRGVLGGILALAGIAIAVSGSLANGVEVSLPHILAILAGAACLAEGGIAIKLFPPSHPFATNAVAMTISTLIMALCSLALGETWTLPRESGTWLALAYIVVGMSVGGFLLYLFVLKNWTATGASYGLVLIPIVTVILAALLTDETITLVFLGGAAVVLVGIYVGALMPAKARPDAIETAAPAGTGPAAPEPIRADSAATQPAAAGSAGFESAMEEIQARPGLPNCI